MSNKRFASIHQFDPPAIVQSARKDCRESWQTPASGKAFRGGFIKYKALPDLKNATIVDMMMRGRLKRFFLLKLMAFKYCFIYLLIRMPFWPFCPSKKILWAINLVAHYLIDL